MPKSKNNNGMMQVEEQIPDSEIRNSNSAPNSPEKNMLRSPKKKVQSLYKDQMQLQLEALTTQVASLAQNVSTLLNHQEKRKDKAGKPSRGTN
jgi:hypothetical protein